MNDLGDMGHERLEKIGSKNRPHQLHIYEITGILSKVLRESTLTDFGTAEQISWAEALHTTRKEDVAYLLLGISGVHMLLIYGNVQNNAAAGLRKAIDREEKGILFSFV
jgi:hypothetical protein